MASDPARSAERIAEQLRPGSHADVAMRSMGHPNSITHQFDFFDDRYEGRRLFSELLGTFFLVIVAGGAGMVNARFGGHEVPASAAVVVPGLMVAAIILFMGTVSGAHLNPAVSFSFALRGDFPWRRVPAYVAAQFAGAVLACLALWALIGRQGSAGQTLPGSGISAAVVVVWEALLTLGLVSVILGTASGAQQVGPLSAIAVGSYIALAGLWGWPVSGASMNPARSLGPALVLGNWTAWWTYLVGPVAGGAIAVGFARILRGPGGGQHGRAAAQGTLGPLWPTARMSGLLGHLPERRARRHQDAVQPGEAEHPGDAAHSGDVPRPGDNGPPPPVGGESAD